MRPTVITVIRIIIIIIIIIITTTTPWHNSPVRVMVNTSHHPAIVSFLDQDYQYNSIIIQIPHNVGLAPIPYTGRKSPPSGNRTTTAFRNTSSKK